MAFPTWLKPIARKKITGKHDLMLCWKKLRDMVREQADRPPPRSRHRGDDQMTDFTQLETDDNSSLVVAALSDALTAMAHFGSPEASRFSVAKLFLSAQTAAAADFRAHERSFSQPESAA
jgi:hypothetical protein